MIPVAVSYACITIWVLNIDRYYKNLTFSFGTLGVILFFVLVGFRSPDLGSDYNNYYIFFESLHSAVRNDYAHFDPGFIKLSEIILIITDNVQSVFVIYALTSAFLLRQIAALYNLKWYAIAVPYIAIFAFSRDVSQFRFSVACLGSIYGGVYYLVKGNRLALSLSVVSSTIHIAVLPITITMAFIYYIKNVPQWLQLIAFTSIFLIAKFFTFTIIEFTYPRAIDYFFASNNFLGILKALLIYTLCQKIHCRNDERHTILIAILSVALSLRIAFWDMALLTNRIASGLETVTIILIALTVSYRRKNILMWGVVLLVLTFFSLKDINLRVAI